MHRKSWSGRSGGRSLGGLALALGLAGVAAACAVAAREGGIGPALAPAAADGVRAYDKAFSIWSALASAQTLSPATPRQGDYVYVWTGPDGRQIRDVVRVPAPSANAPTVTMAPPPQGADARPYFESALNEARARHAGRLLIPAGVYRFESLAKGGAHLQVDGLADLTIDGQGSTLVFTHDAPGVWLSHCQRLRFRNFKIDYAFLTASLGTIESRDGQKVLRVAPQFPVSSDDKVFYVSEFDPRLNRWAQGGKRAIFPPGSANAPVFVGDQTYVTPRFKALPDGASVAVFHHWYGGQAIRVGDGPGSNQSEDVILDGVTIYSSPGMAIFGYGIKRGFAVVNSRIMPRPDGVSEVSGEYDAIHVLSVGGDLVLANNLLSSQGDDGINLNAPVSPILSMQEASRTLALGNYSRFISPGDTIAFFDRLDRYLGQARVVSTLPLGGVNNQVTLDRAMTGMGAAAIVRDPGQDGSRFYVAGNTIKNCNCHGVHAQTPNGLIENNIIENPNHNAIRLLTDIGTFVEGVGAFNVRVTGNTITNSGSEAEGAPRLPWSAISVYGPIPDNLLTPYPMNKDVAITNNVVNGARDGCVTVSSARAVLVQGNVCNSVNLDRPASAIISVFASQGVQLEGNRRSGSSSAGVAIDASTTSEIRSQSQF